MCMKIQTKKPKMKKRKVYYSYYLNILKSTKVMLLNKLKKKLMAKTDIYWNKYTEYVIILFIFIHLIIYFFDFLVINIGGSREFHSGNY